MQKDVITGDTWQYDSRFNILSRRSDPASFTIDPVKLYRFFCGARTLWSFCDASRKPFGLFLENQRGCQLRCTYCYADVGNEAKTKHRVSLGRLRELEGHYNFDNLNIYGGDFFYDWGFGKECLEVLGHKRSIVLSTNGIGLTADRLAFLRSRCDRLLLQLSIEPKHWGSRQSANGTHQNDLLKTRLRAAIAEAGQGLTFSVSLVGPSHLTADTVGTMQSHRDEIDQLLGTSSYVMTYKNVAAIPGGDEDPHFSMRDDEPELPGWMAKLFTEEWEDINSGNYTCQRSRQGVIAGAVDEYRRLAEPENAARPFSFFGCAAGMGALAVGPDDKIYGCHEEAVNMTSEVAFASETPRGAWGRLKHSMGKTDDPVCSKCPEKWHCGGICYVVGANSICESTRACADLALKAAEVLMPAMIEDAARNQRAWLDRTAGVLDSLNDVLASKDWTDLIHGRLPIEAMVALAKDMNGVVIDPDKPLWEQEAMPAHIIRAAAEYDSPV